MAPYKPPTKVRTLDIPWRTMVIRADPDFEYAKKHELYYEFSSGRTFRGDNATDGAYDTVPSIPVPVGIESITIDGAQIGDAIARLSVSGGSGSYSYSLLDSAGGKFKISGDLLLIDDTLVVSKTSIKVRATNGSGSSVTFTIGIDIRSATTNWLPGIRPFIASSPANIKLASGKTYTPVAWPTADGFNYYTGIKFYIDQPADNVSAVVQWLAPSSWGNPTQIVNRIMTPGFAGVTQITGISDGGDNEAVSMAGTQSLNIYNFNRPTDTTASSGAYAFDDVVSGTGFGNASTGAGAGIVAAGCNLLMGCLIKEEFAKYGDFNHWIAFSMIGTLMKPGWTAPAISGDGSHADGLFKTGDLLAIPKNTAMPSGLSIYGQAMFRAMRDYGAFPMDTSGSVTPYMACIYDPNGTNFAASTSWTPADKGLLIGDCNKLFPLLQLVT